MHGNGRFRNLILLTSLQAARAALAIAIVIVTTLVLARPAQAQTLTVLHTFTWEPDGAWPEAGLIFDAAGNLYGTTALRHPNSNL